MFWPLPSQERPHGRTGSFYCRRRPACSVRGPDIKLCLSSTSACRAPRRCTEAQHTRNPRRPSVTDEASFLSQFSLNRPVTPLCTVSCYVATFTARFDTNEPFFLSWQQRCSCQYLNPQKAPEPAHRSTDSTIVLTQFGFRLSSLLSRRRDATKPGFSAALRTANQIVRSGKAPPYSHKGALPLGHVMSVTRDGFSAPRCKLTSKLDSSAWGVQIEGKFLQLFSLHNCFNVRFVFPLAPTCISPRQCGYV